MWFDGSTRDYGQTSITGLAETLPSVGEEIWAADWRSKTFGYHRNTQSLHFLWSPFLENRFSVYDRRAEWRQTAFGRLALKAIEDIRAVVPGQIVRAMITRLDPGAEIKLHFDGIHPIYTECHRLHVPIITEPEVLFHLTDNVSVQTVHFAAGQIAEINNLKFHCVSHGGKNARYHIILDVLPTSYPGSLALEYHSDLSRYEAETHSQDMNKWFPSPDNWAEHYRAEKNKWESRK